VCVVCVCVCVCVCGVCGVCVCVCVCVCGVVCVGTDCLPTHMRTNRTQTAVPSSMRRSRVCAHRLPLTIQPMLMRKKTTIFGSRREPELTGTMPTRTSRKACSSRQVRKGFVIIQE
jgi:hypothetical protein